LPRPRRLSSGDADDIVIADNAAHRSPGASDDASSEQRPALIRQTPAAGGAGAPGPWSADVVAAATHSYLTWLTETNDRITVTGLTGARGTLNVPLERVYTALRLDQSSRAERAAAAENLWRELERELLARDLSPDEEDNLRWILYADLPTAEYLVAGATGEKGKLLHVGEVYHRDNAMVILGDPGSGKTTIMRWLTLVHAQTLLRGQPEVRVQRMHVDAAAQDTEEEAGDFILGQPLLPIPVRVAEYAADRQQRRRRGEQPRSLLQFLGHHSWNRTSPVWTDEDSASGPHGHPIEPELLGHVLGAALRERRALVILDGLDEVPAEERTAVSDAIAEFFARWVPRRIGSRPSNKVIITSRIAGYQLAPLSADLTQVTIEKMTDTALGVFIRNWMREVLSELNSQSGSGADQRERTVEDARSLAAQLTGLIAEPMNRYVRDLATNPMLAAVIVAIFINQGNALPSQRVEVYQSAVETLISVWSERLSRTYDEIESHALFEAIPAVAAHVHATKANGVILAAEFRDHLLEEVARIEGTNPQRPSPALQASVRSLLQIMRVELGLLVESGPGAFRFSHLTFQEFLAAQHLVSDPGQRARRILAHLGDPRWREPILMALGLVNWQHPGQIVRLTTDLLAGIRHRSPGVRAHLLRSCACILNRSRGNDGEWSEYAVPFRIGATRWRQLWDVLRATDPEPLRAWPVLFADPEAILAAAATALAFTGGNLDQGSSERASLALAAEAESSIGEILAAGGESAVLDGLTRFGQSQLAHINAPDRALRALDRLREEPEVSEWPWTGLLADWATDLLAQSVRDEDLCWERCTVIEVLAAIAERNPDTFRRYANTETLTRLLAAGARLQNGWPGRRGAAQLLGILRHGSAEVLNALEEAMRDVPQVREAALYAIPRLRNVDHAVVDGLIAALSGHSAINAWAAAQLLTIIGQNTATPPGRRQAIISALAVAVRGADSRRPVHFAFTEAAIPQMPELDDVFTEAIQRIYRFG
jgi:hypothetical protein